ncbi:MAG: sulfotransferase [Enhydrobacter sp.]|nr:sulfotransferase [Enhydrobacter sp.]
MAALNRQPHPGPDFICIGMQKAGTGWLFDQLQHHPDFWMPPAKELHYFDRDFPDKGLAEVINLASNSPARLARKRSRLNWRPLDDRDFAFFSDAEACRGRGIDLEQYKSLFRHKGELLSGDVTPAYSTLPEHLIEQIVTQIPHVKVLLLLRDPISRAWSEISMAHRRGKLDIGTTRDPEELRLYLDMPGVRRRSFGTEIYSRWSRHVPPDQIRYFFLDHIGSEPDRVRRDVLLFLGGDPAKSSGDLDAAFNRKSDQHKLELTPLAKGVLVEHLASEVKASAAMFGGPAVDWVKRYGL